jgi:uncharacterized RDD family membrane protein YckC
MESSSFPGQIQPDQGVPVEGVGFLLRAIARIIDLIIHNIVGIPLGFLAGLVIGLIASASGMPVPNLAMEDPTWKLASSGFAIAGFIFYSAICEAYYGATAGKLILGLFVVDRKGAQISFGAGLIRSVLFFVDSLLFGLVGYAFMKDFPLKQRLGDRAAGTVVVKRSEVRSSEIPSGLILGIVLLLALVFDAVVQVLPVFLMVAAGQ